MTARTPAARRTARRRAGVVAIAAGGLAGITIASTSAVLTDSDTVRTNQFSSGNVDIAARPASAVFDASNLQPGDVIVAPVAITNTGTQDLRYALTTKTTEGVLASTLQMTIRAGVSSCTVNGFASTGTVVANSQDFGSVVGINTFGDPKTGQNGTVNGPGADRVLAATKNETLCVRVEMPTTAPSNVQGINTVATFTFSAEQTNSN